MPAAAVSVGPVKVTYVHEDPTSGYALLEWEAPAGAASPPVHVHHRTDEGFYVLSGSFRFLVDGEQIDARSGCACAGARGPAAHVLELGRNGGALPHPPHAAGLRAVLP